MLLLKKFKGGSATLKAWSIKQPSHYPSQSELVDISKHIILSLNYIFIARLCVNVFFFFIIIINVGPGSDYLWSPVILGEMRASIGPRLPLS